MVMLKMEMPETEMPDIVNSRAGNATDGNAGDGNVASHNAANPPLQGSGLPLDIVTQNICQSGRQQRIQNQQYMKPIKIKDPKRFKEKPREDFDNWWVTMQGNIQDQNEKFGKNKMTIDLIGSIQTNYAAAWRIH
jgi:hypothetical protein